MRKHLNFALTSEEVGGQIIGEDGLNITSGDGDIRASTKKKRDAQQKMESVYDLLD